MDATAGDLNSHRPRHPPTIGQWREGAASGIDRSMVDHAEIPQGFRVDPVSDMPSVDGKGWQQNSATPWNPVSKVLDDDDLLQEIIVRLGFPISLIRASLVCKRWYHHASDPAFLRRFRKLHPARPLGFYISNNLKKNPALVPMLQPTPLPQELATVIRRARFSLGTYSYKSTRTRIVDCWGGNIFLSLHNYNGGTGSMFAVYKPLCAERGMHMFLSFPCQQLQGSNIRIVSSELLFREGHGLSYMWMESTKERATVHISRLQDGAWTTHASVTTELHGLPLSKKLLLVDQKVYICAASYILVFDLTDLSFSKIQYPQEVGFPKVVMLSQADDDDGLYLIHAKEFQLGIWLHKMDNWLMVDNICLCELYANLRISDNMHADKHKVVVRISQVGPNAEFVFLQVGQFILYLDIKPRVLHKVYELTMIDRVVRHSVHPFMIWPPIFPALKDNHERDAM